MAAKKKISKKKAKKKIAKKKVAKNMQVAMSAEEMVEGLRRRGGHLPTKASEAARKRKMKKKTRKSA